MQITNLTSLGWHHYFQSQLTIEALESQYPFRVIAVQRHLIECVGFDSDNQLKQLTFSTYHWRDHTPEDYPTVGDWLMLNESLEPLYLLERKTCIKRKRAGKESMIQLIASNIDTLFIVTSCNEDFNINRIERYLSIAAESDIYCVLVLTKIDLCEDIATYTDAITHSYPDLAVEAVNGIDRSTLNGLEKWIGMGQTVALAGSSGVGKSTIINNLIGDQLQATGAIRESDSKGRHTTTARSLHALPGGGLLLDSPGMRELQLIDSEEGIKATFSDIDALALGCRFNNCQHQQEPGCAVIQAIAEGKLEQRRLDNYHKLLSEHIRNSESLAERRHNDRALGRFYRQAFKSARQFKSKQ